MYGRIFVKQSAIRLWRTFLTLGAFLGFLLVAGVSFAAQSNPSFPSCNAPQGSVIASYSEGTHGVPGDSTTYTGADNVYQVSGNQVLQCFCGGSNGIQSNWWKVGNLSSGDISYWQSQGWTYIPDGSAWGLESTGYLAYNAHYTCSSNNPNSGGPGDGLGCATHDCSGNQVGGPSSSGNTDNEDKTGFFDTVTTGVVTVLGTATDPKTSGIDLTKSICATCLWWPMLLGEVIALAALYLVLKRRSLPVNKYLLGVVAGLVAYLIFLLVNKGHACPDSAGIAFWKFTVPCRYFWTLDGLLILAFSFFVRNVTPLVSKTVKKSSKRK